MVIDRRGFMQGAALIVVGNLLPLSSDIRSYASPSPGFAPTESAVNGTAANLVFRVNGWDCLGDSTGDEIFLSVNQAWRTAWR
jgi:hypothetical protein